MCMMHDVLCAGAGLCNRYGITVADLLNKLDAFLITEDMDVLTLESLGKFEQGVRTTANKVPISFAKW